MYGVLLKIVKYTLFCTFCDKALLGYGAPLYTHKMLRTTTKNQLQAVCAWTHMSATKRISPYFIFLQIKMSMYNNMTALEYKLHIYPSKIAFANNSVSSSTHSV